MEDPIIVGVRLGLYLTLCIAFGVPLFSLCVLDRSRRAVLPLRAIVALGATAALMLTLLGWVATTAAMADKPLFGITYDDLTGTFAMPGLGASWLVRIASLVALIFCTVRAAWGPKLPVVAAVLGALALGSLAWSGHGSAGDRLVGQVHVAADVVHLLGAGAWVGALIGFVLLLWRLSRDPSLSEVLADGLTSFGRTGTIIVAAIMGSGLVNSWVLVTPARVLDLPSTSWGRLLLAKIALFIGMLALAAVNRWVLTPASSATRSTTAPQDGRLRWTVTLETGVAILILALVAWLGTLSPPASA